MPKRHRIIQRFEGIPLQRPGDLTFEALLNGTHQASQVVIVNPAPVAPIAGVAHKRSEAGGLRSHAALRASRRCASETGSS